MIIPFLDLKEINKEIEKDLTLAYQRVVHSGQYILSKQVVDFENEFSTYCGTTNCIGVSNGLMAIELIITALHLPKHSEILVAANTCIATIMAISNTGNIPVLVEPDITSYNIDVSQITNKITNKTKAIIAVHLYGKCCDMNALKKIALENNLYLIEDAAQAHGSIFENQKAGSFGIAAGFSFYPTKNLGAFGDGGAVTTNNSKLADEIRYLRNYGSIKKNIHKIIGFNSRLDELQAAFLTVKLKKIDQQNAVRRSIAEYYSEKLSNSSCILPLMDSAKDDNWHLFVIRHLQRDKLKSYLEKNGISTAIHYPIPSHMQKAYENKFKGQFTITEKLAQEILSLPCNPCITKDNIEYISNIIYNFDHDRN